MLSALLIVWKYFNANKWNNFNSHQIEFKSNYPPEESLIHSFQIDTDFVDNETSIDDDYHHSGDDGVINDSDENADGDNDNANSINGHSQNGYQNGMKSKRAAAKAKFSKNSNRCGGARDQYSEKRCLMNSTADDEQFDFTPQTTL